MVGKRHRVEERGVASARRAGQIAFDRRRRAVADGESEVSPAVVVVGRDPQREVAPECLRARAFSKQHQGGVVGGEHGAVCAQAKQAAGLNVQQAPELDDLHRRVEFLVVHS